VARRGRALACLAAALALLAACGFEPLYGESSGAGPAALARVRVAPIRDQPDPTGRSVSIARAAQLLRGHLLDRIAPRGEAAAPLYELRVRLTESKSELGLRTDETATRGRLDLVAAYELTRLDHGRPVLTSTTRSVVSYNILRNQFATLSAENDARRRAAREVSETIANRVAAAIGGAPSAAAP
jgi:LPS-assembly lipoprotein